MFGVGVILFLLDRTGSPALAGITIAAITLPSLITGPFLGAWLDLTGRRRKLIVIDHVAIVVCLVAILLVAGNGPDALVPAIAFVAGLTYPLSFGGFTSFIPVIVPDHLLTQANALEAASFNTALIMGPALAGGITAVAGPGWPLVVEAAITLVALALLMTLRNLDQPRDRRADGRTLRGIVRAGLRQVASVPELRGVTAAAAIGLGGIGLLTVAFPLFAVEELGAERSAAGYLWAAFAFGSLVGAMGLVRFYRDRAPELVVLGAIAGFGLLMLSWPLATALLPALVLVALAGMVDGPGLATTFAVRQRSAPRELHGQVFTTAVSLKIGALSLGAGLAGPVSVAFGPDGAILIAAVTQLVAAVVGLALMRWPAPRATAAEGARSRP